MTGATLEQALRKQAARKHRPSLRAKGSGHVAGWARDSRVRLVAYRRIVSSWSLCFTGTIHRAGRGRSEIRGTIGWSPFLKAFTVLELSGSALFFLVGVAASLDPNAVGVDGFRWLAPLIGPAAAATLLIGATWLTRIAEEDASYLEGWLRKQLSPSEPAPDGPRQG